MLTGFSPRIAQTAVSAFREAHPNVRLTLSAGTHEELFQLILADRVDLLVSDQRRALSDLYVNDFLGEQPLCAMVNRSHPLAGALSIDLAELREEMCILIAPEAQRQAEADYWRDIAGVRSDIPSPGVRTTPDSTPRPGRGFSPATAICPASLRA